MIDGKGDCQEKDEDVYMFKKGLYEYHRVPDGTHVIERYEIDLRRRCA